MQRLIGRVTALLLLWLLGGCASTAEITGQKVSTAISTTRLSTVDVIFLDTPSLRRNDLGAVFSSPSSYSGLTDRVAMDVRRAMSEVRDGVQASLNAHGIAGRAFLASDRLAPPKALSHLVQVTMTSAQANAQGTGTIVLQVAVYEAASNLLLWKGESETSPGVTGFSKQARDEALARKQRNFGEGVVRALRESGLLASN